MTTLAWQPVDNGAIERAMRRLAQAEDERHDPATIEAILDRARAQLEEFAETAAKLEADLPYQIGEAIREGLRSETLPVARQLAETRGLSVRAIRRLERVECDLQIDRHARIDDLALLVDLISSGWRGIDERLSRIEAALAPRLVA